MKSFDYWKKLHESEKLEEFSSDEIGLLWLKVKSIVRKEIISEFVTENNIELRATSLQGQFIELYSLLVKNPKNSHNLLNEYIKRKNKSILAALDTKKLVSELYKLKSFDWGGDYQNSLDKYLVSRYVKALQSYDTLVSKFETEISAAVQGYVLNSWYNHWSSILIEHLFKSHKVVLPAVGQIKHVDVCYEIREKLKDKNTEECKQVIKTLKEQKLQILKEATENPRELAKWLYENQGEMRFGSENRLFLVLVDTDDFTGSWKLKRNMDLLKPVIENYLDNFDKKKVADLKVAFRYKGKPQTFTALTDVVFIVK
ncbi:MAG: hypothetical protein HW390_3108 [Candidatus Brocadiaceae bacterium]|nr:hypothetical protein [Candidatus Brocadiaceae bacterium]